MQSIKLFVAVSVTLALAIVGCARDTNEEGAGDTYPFEVNLAFRMRESLDPNTWYFMVFNFTAAPSTAIATAPIDIISNEDRGKNWELYVALNTNTVGEDTLVTLQRPAEPTLLPVAEGPVDVGVADINHDGLMDIVVACRAAGEIQVLDGGLVGDTYEEVFFGFPRTVDTGPQPFRLFTGPFVDEAFVDVLVLFAGEDGASPMLRILAGNDGGTLGPVGDTELASGIPIDALVADFNNDSILDLAYVTTKVEAGDGELRIVLRDPGGSFNESASYPIGPDPAQLAIGQLDDGGLDLAVAVRGTAASDGEVYIFHGAGDGTFTPRATPLAVPGACTSVAIGPMFGIVGDLLDDVLVGYVDSFGVGNLGVFLNNPVAEGETPGPGEAFGELFTSIPTQIQPNYIVAFDTSNDNHLDALVVDGSPGSGSNTFLIQRGLTEEIPPLAGIFAWDPEPITYPSGVEPSRIILADINLDGLMDVLTPNTAIAEGGSSVSLFYGLGKDNFTSSDVFWVDQEPQLLVLKDWYLRHTVGPNFFELVIDPGLFYDLAERPPTEFIVDFMTADAGINILDNLDALGEVEENMSTPVNVPMEIAFFVDEQNSPKVNVGAVALGYEDIIDWRIEVE